MVSSNMVVTSKEPSDNFQMRQQFSKLRTHIERAELLRVTLPLLSPSLVSSSRSKHRTRSAGLSKLIEPCFRLLQVRRVKPFRTQIIKDFSAVSRCHRSLPERTVSTPRKIAQHAGPSMECRFL